MSGSNTGKWGISLSSLAGFLGINAYQRPIRQTLAIDGSNHLFARGYTLKNFGELPVTQAAGGFTVFEAIADRIYDIDMPVLLQRFGGDPHDTQPPLDNDLNIGTVADQKMCVVNRILKIDLDLYGAGLFCLLKHIG